MLYPNTGKGPTLGDMVARSDCYDFEYSQLDDAVAVFDRLVLDARAAGQVSHAD